ncbi:MAG TPA: hypothetical protein QF361_07465, partial [Gammaproteobacteria bacterium]|nr:hypothetical protein [Gammaproteobacteria bacterium]
MDKLTRCVLAATAGATAVVPLVVSAEMAPLQQQDMRNIDGQLGPVAEIIIDGPIERRAERFARRALLAKGVAEFVDERTGLDAYIDRIDRNTGIERLIDLKTGPSSWFAGYIDRRTGVETLIDLNTGLGAYLDRRRNIRRVIDL